ncbi:MAG TPA: hypothetical protein PKW55_05345 [Spirochaetota bacterium]|nr:hypothetical protein [Spirochaetota bacterium]HOM37623.1 hypothetical protein [Spirochaetota bacterium]HPQ49406.1 hypothetical protein [Spirochaetota bacterium]
MKIKSYIFILAIINIFQLISYPTYANFDPGDVLSATKRSLGLINIFRERWNIMKNSKSIYELTTEKKSRETNYYFDKKESNEYTEREVTDTENNNLKKDIRELYYYLNRGSYSKYVDLFLKYDYIPDFDVNTPFGKKELDMNYLILSSMVKFDNIIKTDLFSWGLGIGVSGARYGLTRNVELTGPNGEKFETIDMVYNQVYDDLVVVSNTFNPIGDIHIGLLFNRDIDVGIDNVIGTSDDYEKKFKTLFINTNILNVEFTLGYNYEKDESNNLEIGVNVMDMLYDYTNWVENRYLWPDFKLSYIYYKNEFEKLANHILYFDFMYSTYSYFYIKLKGGIPLYGQEGFEKEVGIKEILCEIGFHPKFAKIARNPEEYYSEEYKTAFFYYILAGFSLFNDNRLTNFGNKNSTVYGFMVGIKVSFAAFIGGIDSYIKFSRNYSEKINRMIETYNKNYIEFAIQIGF